MNEGNIISIQLLGRAAMYEYLAMIFKEPPALTFIGLSAKYYPAFEALAGVSDSSALESGVTYLRDYIAWETAIGDKLFVSEMNKAYTSLFSLGFNSAPITASAVLTPGGTMKQDPWDKVTDFYSEWGFKTPKGFNEPEDHIYVQLKFMQKLSELAANLSAKDEEEKLLYTIKSIRLFISDHMLNWIPKFRELLNRLAGNEFEKYSLYKAGATLTEGFVTEDEKVIMELSSKP